MKPIEAHSTAKIKAKVTREEQAAHELGITQFATGTRIALVLVFVTVITSVPLIQICTAFRQPERVTRFGEGLRSFIPPWARVKEADGVIAAANLLPTSAEILKVEEQWEEDSVVGEVLLPRMQSLMLAMGQGNEKAYAGRDGWLYYRADFDHVAGRPFLDSSVMSRRTKIAGSAKAPQPDPVKGIVHFRDELAKRGVKLIVMPMPVKPTIYPEFLSYRYPIGSKILQNPSYGEFKQRLSKAGVTVFDPSDLLAEAKASQSGQPLYMKTDTHWTPQAMESTAAKLAGFARETATLPESQAKLYKTVDMTVEALGDVTTMLKLPAGQKVLPPEKVQLRQVLQGTQLWRPAANAEVLFLGDSFANIYSLEKMGWGESAGFVEHLSLALGMPVDAITRNDGGSYATREMLANEMKRGNDRLAGKKLVIWEFAARELSSGDWKELSMALGEKRDLGMYVPAEGRTVAIKGIVRAVSPSPRPGSVPYKDHILMLHLTDIESSDDVVAKGKEAVVKTWSMRDNVATPASRYRPGDTVRLNIRPWADVQAKYGSINGSLLDNDDAVYADHGWADYEPNHKTNGKATTPTKTTAPTPEPPPEGAAVSPLQNDLASAFREVCAQKSAAAGDAMAIVGTDKWLFLGNELRHIGVGPFWGENAAKASKAPAKDADPLPAILDFKTQLDALGIELILAPVPPKAVIYPEKISDAVKAPADGKAPARLDATHQEFYKLLREKGVKVLDLTDDFLANRTSADGPIYCQQDTHWSGLACNLAAKKLAEMIRKMDWYASVKPAEFKQEVVSTPISGDLWTSLDEAARPEKETLKLRKITTAAGELVKPDPDSPVILLGDSHNLVFQAGGDMQATGAGLADQLAYELGIAVDLRAVRGSGATPARINLYRAGSGKPEFFTKKKVVIWCFTAREFTESQGWRLVPVTKK